MRASWTQNRLTAPVGSDYPLVEDAAAIADTKQFAAKHAQRILKGIGHNVPQAAPKAFARAVVEVDSYGH